MGLGAALFEDLFLKVGHDGWIGAPPAIDALFWVTAYYEMGVFFPECLNESCLNAGGILNFIDDDGVEVEG